MENVYKPPSETVSYLNLNETLNSQTFLILSKLTPTDKPMHEQLGHSNQKQRYDCVLPPNTLCSKVPDLNVLKTFENKVESSLKELGKRGGWPKNPLIEKN